MQPNIAGLKLFNRPLSYEPALVGGRLMKETLCRPLERAWILFTSLRSASLALGYTLAPSTMVRCAVFFPHGKTSN